jgi:hypothetical protein
VLALSGEVTQKARKESEKRKNQFMFCIGA